jgi:hypothetical protein
MRRGVTPEIPPLGDVSQIPGHPPGAAMRTTAGVRGRGDRDHYS